MNYAQKRRYWLAIALWASSSSSLFADGVNETNYLHIDPNNAINLNAFLSASTVRRAPIDVGKLRIGARLGLNPAGQLGLTSAISETDSFAILADEDMCAVGLKVRLPSREARNSIRVEFKFLARDGSLIDTETRWPALGTTLQSFSSDDFSNRFAGVEITTDTHSKSAIGEIKLLPCSLAVS